MFRVKMKKISNGDYLATGCDGTVGQIQGGSYHKWGTAWRILDPETRKNLLPLFRDFPTKAAAVKYFGETLVGRCPTGEG